MAARSLIVNADDFGQTPGVNRGIIAAHENGIVTSASLMTHGAAVREAVDYALSHPALGLGLHADLGEWFFRDGAWHARYQRVRVEDAGEVARELAAQLDAFQRLTGRAPTHLDSHQNVHMREPARSCFAQAAARWNIPLRACAPGFHWCGDFYGQTAEGLPFPQAIRPESLVRIIETLPAGVTVLVCHPAERADLETTYLHERRIELATLCDRRVRAALASRGVALRSFEESAAETKSPDRAVRARAARAL
ncbi:MAG TPA: ChbG/HpnK family deacetylase [Burkholderiales bacterium]